MVEHVWNGKEQLVRKLTAMGVAEWRLMVRGHRRTRSDWNSGRTCTRQNI